MKRVLVGCPTYDGKAYVLEQYARMVKGLDYPDFDILLMDNSKSDEYAKKIEALGLPVVRCEQKEAPKATLVSSRNMLREHALKNGYDYLFSLEQDVLVDFDTLARLVAHEKDYVTTVVLNVKRIQGKQVVVPMLSVPWEEQPGKLRYVKMADLEKGPLIEVAQAHLACTLLSRRILEQHEFRFEDDAYDDTCLSEDLRDAGEKLWCDTTIRPKHMPSPHP